MPKNKDKDNKKQTPKMRTKNKKKKGNKSDSDNDYDPEEMPKAGSPEFKDMVSKQDKNVIAIDFDGVIHKNSKGFHLFSYLSKIFHHKSKNLF